MKEALQMLISFLENNNFPKTSKVLKEELGKYFKFRLSLIIHERTQHKNIKQRE